MSNKSLIPCLLVSNLSSSYLRPPPLSPIHVITHTVICLWISLRSLSCRRALYKLFCVHHKGRRAVFQHVRKIKLSRTRQRIVCSLLVLKTTLGYPHHPPPALSLLSASKEHPVTWRIHCRTWCCTMTYFTSLIGAIHNTKYNLDLHSLPRFHSLSPQALILCSAKHETIWFPGTNTAPVCLEREGINTPSASTIIHYYCNWYTSGQCDIIHRHALKRDDRLLDN